MNGGFHMGRCPKMRREESREYSGGCILILASGDARATDAHQSIPQTPHCRKHRQNLRQKKRKRCPFTTNQEEAAFPLFVIPGTPVIHPNPTDRYCSKWDSGVSNKFHWHYVLHRSRQPPSYCWPASVPVPALPFHFVVSHISFSYSYVFTLFLYCCAA